jgi:phosphoribosylanthranilate isomerase
MVIKVCGITNPEDASAAADAGATALGFNFYPASPRYVAPERAASIRTRPGMRRVGVFVNETRARMEDVARAAALDTVQLHGDEPPSGYPEGFAVWKAVRVEPGFDLAAFDSCPAEALLLDGPAGELYGGSGRTFDWSVAAASGRRLILAGGLDSANVARAISLARPWGVDSCSRIESSPGKKDHGKMIEFIQAARAAFGL